MKITPQIIENSYGVLRIVFIVLSLFFITACHKQLRIAQCAAPINVNCGKWTQLGTGTGVDAYFPFTMENTAQVTLPTRGAEECANNAGTITIPSNYSGFTIYITSPLICSIADTRCVCVGSAFLPPPQPYPPALPYPTVSGEYTVNLICTDTNSGATETFVNTGDC